MLHMCFCISGILSISFGQGGVFILLQADIHFPSDFLVIEFKLNCV